MTLKLLSPAKLNLFLHVVGQRPNDYHDIQTVFQLLDYGDILSFELTENTDINLLNTLNIPKEANLIYQAAKALQLHTGTNMGTNIDIEKKLPMGAGLGGGSSNAATTLLALNQLWGTNLSINTLTSIGKSLGADVPIFVNGHSAWGEGIGEHLTPVKLPEKWYLVITPNCHVSTTFIFSQPDLKRDTPRISYEDFLKENCHNDLEPIAKKHHPEINDAINWLSHYAKAKMTGSGASVFAEFGTEDEAQEVLKRVPEQYAKFVAKGINTI